MGPRSGISARLSRFLKVSPRSGRSEMHSNADEWSVRTRDEHNVFAQISCTSRFLWRSHRSSPFVQQSVCHCEFFFISVPVTSRNGRALFCE